MEYSCNTVRWGASQRKVDAPARDAVCGAEIGEQQQIVEYKLHQALGLVGSRCSPLPPALLCSPEAACTSNSIPVSQGLLPHDSAYVSEHKVTNGCTTPSPQLLALAEADRKYRLRCDCVAKRWRSRERQPTRHSLRAPASSGLCCTAR